MAKLESVSPISNEDTRALSVKALEPAIAYYKSVMGFTLIAQNATTALLRRDDAEIGLVVKMDHRPREAGSVAFAVDDLDALHHELAERGGQPGEFGLAEWGGK
ncbi:MAG TPA: VOC family protein, partial [Blastocatellia bacterium]|nr:VOC family protein [Blastocatellia bacterium]